MSQKNQNLPPRKPSGELRSVVNERLSGSNTNLTSLFFNQGANIYVFSYEKEGQRRYTLIDSGDSQHRDRILSILTENDINPSSIERIIITHRHFDHCGLAALLAQESGAKIVVHPNFRSLVEGKLSREERGGSLSEAEILQLRGCDIEYLAQSDERPGRSINGLDFPILGEPIEIGEGARLEIVGCPECTPTHTRDQVIVFYSPRNGLGPQQKTDGAFRPTDDMAFSGDLWLMTGPATNRSFRDIFHQLRWRFVRLKRLLASLLSGKGSPWTDPRDQDAKAKEALKKGFNLIRVKPGHGEEFLGSRIIPAGVLADRDLLVALGHPFAAKLSILKREDLAPKIAALKEQAYADFIGEVLSWRKLGYTLDEASELLVRIYKEQTGGGKLVQKDRNQRRQRLKETLARLKGDTSAPEELRQLAQSTLLALDKVLV